MIIKSSYKNAQNMWQENYVKWFIELDKKILKKISFQEISNVLLKTILNEWFQFIYLQNVFFKWFDSIPFVFNLKKKYYLHLLYQKNLSQNFNLATKIIFTCFYHKWMNFYDFI